MLLHIARHGETELNAHGDRYQGSTDAPLNARGLAQAQALADALPARIDAIVCSPLLRARQTAAPVAAARGLAVVLHPAFREREFGEFEGLSPQEAEARHPALWAAGVMHQWHGGPPGAESPQAVVDRVAAGLAELRRRHAGQHVLLVCHGFVVRALRYLLDPLDRPAFFALPKLANGGFISRELAEGPPPGSPRPR